MEKFQDASTDSTDAALLVCYRAMHHRLITYCFGVDSMMLEIPSGGETRVWSDFSTADGLVFNRQKHIKQGESFRTRT